MIGRVREIRSIGSRRPEADSAGRGLDLDELEPALPAPPLVPIRSLPAGNT
jgi:hypothetical protein